MDSPRKEYLCEIYKGLLGCVEKFEVKVKNDFNEQKQSTIVCDNPQYSDDNDTQDNFKQILRHLKEIKLHLDTIKQLDENICKISSVVKRHVSSKKEVRQPQMKYLVQWEKYLDEHKLVDDDGDAVEVEEILPKPIIKKRIKQFEGTNKRVSSTNEKILDVRVSCLTEKMEHYKKIFEEEEEDTELAEKEEELQDEWEDDDKNKNRSATLPNLFNETTDSSKPKIVEVIYKQEVTNRMKICV